MKGTQLAWLGLCVVGGEPGEEKILTETARNRRHASGAEPW